MSSENTQRSGAVPVTASNSAMSALYCRPFGMPVISEVCARRQPSFSLSIFPELDAAQSING